MQRQETPALGRASLSYIRLKKEAIDINRLEIKTIRKRLYARQWIALILLLLIAVSLCVQPAFASPWSYTTENGVTRNMVELSSKFARAYSLLVNISLACAVVGLAVSALELLIADMMSEMELQKMKRRIAVTAIAIAAIYLLPTVVKMGLSIGQALQWNPWNPS